MRLCFPCSIVKQRSGSTQPRPGSRASARRWPPASRARCSHTCPDSTASQRSYFDESVRTRSNTCWLSLFQASWSASIFADRVILTLYGEAYVEAVPVLRIVIWVFVLNFVNPFLSHLLFARGEPAKSLGVALATFAVFLTLAFALIPRWGAVGAAWASLGSTTVACGLYSAAAFRAEPKRVLMTFGRTGIAAASLAAFLAVWRHAHPAALAVGALGVYVGALLVMGVPSPREFSAFLRGSH